MHSSVRACVSQRRVSYRFLQSRCKERKRGLTQQPSARNVNWIGMGMYSPFFPFFIFFRDKVSPSLWVLPSTVFSSRLFSYSSPRMCIYSWINHLHVCGGIIRKSCITALLILGTIPVLPQAWKPDVINECAWFLQGGQNQIQGMTDWLTICHFVTGIYSM